MNLKDEVRNIINKVQLNDNWDTQLHFFEDYYITKMGIVSIKNGRKQRKGVKKVVRIMKRELGYEGLKDYVGFKLEEVVLLDV
jgi:hypothetical protein